MSDFDLEVAPKRRDRYADLESRVRKLEAIASNWEHMYQQLEAKMKALADRQGNVQAVYDYMVKVGSTIVTKKTDHVAFLNPNNDPKRLNRKNKFEVGDLVYYADEPKNKVFAYVIKGIDYIDGHPRYCLEDLFGYVDESKLFGSEREALNQLRQWRENYYE
jgi:hypothetical protein